MNPTRRDAVPDAKSKFVKVLKEGVRAAPCGSDFAVSSAHECCEQHRASPLRFFTVILPTLFLKKRPFEVRGQIGQYRG